jgi:uncharacterized membrane protein
VKLYLIAYFSTALVFLGCDVVWLSVAATRLYKPKLGPLLLDRFDAAPAIAFYLLYILGILVFAVFPALATARWTTALARGALLGLVAYATYDLTNQATLKGWSTTVTIADLCWGTALTGIAATAGFLATRWIAMR